MTDTTTAHKAPPALGPYSQGRKAGGFLFITGQLGLDPQTSKLVEGGFKAQAEQCVRNIAAIAAEAGTSIEKTIKTTVMVTDLKQFGVINELYATVFKDPMPARASFECSALPLGAVVEIDAIVEL